MKQLDLVIQNETGLHARPAKALVNLAKTFDSDIKITHGAKKVNAKSMISVLTLGVKKSGQVLIEISGDDEAEASEAIFLAVNSGLTPNCLVRSKQLSSGGMGGGVLSVSVQHNNG